jgi:hypothetical protein
VDNGIVRLDFAADEDAGECRDDHQCQDHREVFDDQPADSDAAAVAVEDVAILQSLEQYDRGGHRERKPKQQASGNRPTHEDAEPEAERRGATDLHERAGDGDSADREQVLEREMQADAEHQEDNADFAQLLRQRLIGNETRRVGTDEDAGDQVANDRGEPEAVGEKTQKERQHERRNNGRN